MPGIFPDYPAPVLRSAGDETEMADRHVVTGYSGRRPPHQCTGRRNRWKSPRPRNSESLLAAGTGTGLKDSSLRRSHLDAHDERTQARNPHAARLGDLRLQEAGAIRECEQHGWMQDRADPHARERALAEARRDPPPGVSPEEAVAAVGDVLNSIGDTARSARPTTRQITEVQRKFISSHETLAIRHVRSLRFLERRGRL
jgi:hypothetical protein